jgi:glycosyltransferase involved in cell wall biosynthesis
MSIQKIFVIDGNAPWVRSLFLAMTDEVEVYFLHVQSVPYFRGVLHQAWNQAFKFEAISPNVWDQHVLVPGWTKFFALSSSVLSHCCRRLMRRVGEPDAIVYTNPYYAQVTQRFARIKKVYYAHDPFKFFGWNVAQVEKLEQEMLDCSDLVFAISKQLELDFKQQTQTPVYHSPNAVSEPFIRAFQQSGTEVPPDIAAIPQPIVGCVGQMTRTVYDWHLIEQLANQLPQVSFVFIGPFLDEAHKQDVLIQELLNEPNVYWLGSKEHQMLPAYIHHFDICFNALAVNEHNNRRSPLRLFDYMATSKPILSTAVREAFEHQPFVSVGKDAHECITLISQMLSGLWTIDVEKRDTYMMQHTWKRRAGAFLNLLKEYISVR